MRFVLLIVALVSVPSAGRSAEMPLELAIAIAKAKLALKTPETPAPKVEDKPKASTDKVEWKSYANAHKAYLENKQPLFVMIGAEWCGPCKSLKAEIERASIAGVNYAYVDVDKEPKNVAALGYVGNFTIPKVRFYDASAGYDLTGTPAAVVEYLRQHAKAEDFSSAVDKYLESAKKFQAGVKALKADVSAAPYSWRVVRVARPIGFQPAYVAGMTFYEHIVRDHYDAMKEVLSRVSIHGMSDNELFALHSLLHSGHKVGHWEGRVFVFELP